MSSQKLLSLPDGFVWQPGLFYKTTDPTIVAQVIKSYESSGEHSCLAVFIYNELEMYKENPKPIGVADFHQSGMPFFGGATILPEEYEKFLPLKVGPKYRMLCGGVVRFNDDEIASEFISIRTKVDDKFSNISFVYDYWDKANGHKIHDMRLKKGFPSHFSIVGYAKEEPNEQTLIPLAEWDKAS